MNATETVIVMFINVESAQRASAKTPRMINQWKSDDCSSLAESRVT